MYDGNQMLAESERASKKVRAVTAPGKGGQTFEA
jgi:hypothetical protein